MTKTYNQQCPIAMALDAIGDRWSLLVVRELMLGPLRYGEIAQGLPGIGSRQLTERLGFLAGEGVIAPVRLPGPGEVGGYELTSSGRGLAPSLAALAVWGLQRWKDSPQGSSSPTSVALMMWARAARHDGGLRLAADVVVERVPFRFTFADSGVQATRVRQGEEPATRLEMEQGDALALLSGRLTLARATKGRRLRLHGPDAEALAQILLGPAA